MQSKTLNGVEYIEDSLGFKILNPIEGTKLIDQHIYNSGKTEGYACLALYKPDDKFNAFESWTLKHKIMRETGIWINGLSHNRVDAAFEQICKILNTNRVSIKKMVRNTGYHSTIISILKDMSLTDGERVKILEELLNE